MIRIRDFLTTAISCNFFLSFVCLCAFPLLSFPSSILVLYICPCLSICLNLLNQRANTTSEPLSAAHLRLTNLICFVSQAARSLTLASLLSSSWVLLTPKIHKHKKKILNNSQFKWCLRVNRKIPSWMRLWWIKHYGVPSWEVWWSAFSILYICHDFLHAGAPFYFFRPWPLNILSPPLALTIFLWPSQNHAQEKMSRKAEKYERRLRWNRLFYQSKLQRGDEGCGDIFSAVSMSLLPLQDCETSPAEPDRQTVWHSR